MTTPVAILISGTGSNMLALARAMEADLPATCVLVASDRADAAGLTRAAEMGLPTAALDRATFDSRAAFEAALDGALREAGAELVCLAGFMRVLSADFTGRWAGKVLNIHPSLLPKYPGLDTHARALAAGDAEHGCTVHEVTAQLDAGPILGQARLGIREGESAEDLAARVLPLEHRLYPAVLARLIAGERGVLRLTEEAT